MPSAPASASPAPVAPRCTRATAAVTAAALFFAQLAPGLAQIAGAPQVVAGSVSFDQAGGTRTITQHSGTAIIQWQDFSVKTGDLTRFVQPGAGSAVLNRVLGGQPSLLDGRLAANGSVYLVNPNGVVVGPQGRIDVGAFFASTLDVADDDFLKGAALRFAGDSRAGVQNLGEIKAADGDVMLVAYTVRNAGQIDAPRGVAGLAAGSEVLYTRTGDQRIAVKSGLSAGNLGTGVENTSLVQAAQAELKAAGGNVYALAVNQAGVVRATGVENKDGRVLLVADAGDLRVSGDIAARNADGSGGTILVGGGYQGKNPAVPHAANTTVTASAKLDASAAAATGHGGQIVVWSDRTTRFAGDIAARGGRTGGDGGSLEVSGLRVLDFTGIADTTAPAGRRGTLLLDPDAIIIGTAADQNLFSQGGFIQAQAIPSFVNASTLNTLLASTDVEIRTGDSVGGPAGYNGISVNADLAWSSTSNLKLVSGDTIAINANINAGTTGTLTLMPGTVASADSSTGAITLASGKAITVNTLTIEKSSLASANGANIGAINLAGIVNAATVDLVRNSGGIQGDVTLTHASNQIGTLRGTGAAGAITGSLRVNDSGGGLILSGNLGGITGTVDIATTGNLTVAAGALVKNTGASDLVLAARSGSFVNQAGASAIDASGAGRYLIYSDTPTNTTKGGLTGATTYNKTYAANAPASITATGDRFLFSLAPTLTFTADSLAKTYGAANPVFTYSVTGLQSGDTLAAAVTGTPALSTTATAATAAGTAAISVATGSLAATDLGYGLSFQSGTLTINKAALTVTADNAARTYGAANPAFTASFSGLVNGDTAATAVSGLSLATTATATTGIGTAAITASGATSANYALTYAAGTLTINRAPLTITPDSLAKTYGAANPALTATYSGLVAGDTAAVVSGLTLSTTATAASGIGTYPITAAGATAANYSVSFGTGNLTVNRAPLTIAAAHAARTYGAANPAFSATYTGFVNGDTAAVVSGLTLATPATAASGVGTYAITPSGASAANYSVSFTAGTLTVNPAALTITAADAAKTYGAANPAFTATYTGFVNGDTAAAVSGLTLASPATAASGAGTYAITPSGATAANYTITHTPGTLTVNKAPLTVTPADATRTYGAANPAFSATYTGFVNGDTASVVSGLALATTATAASDVGTYSITGSGASAANYAFTYGTGNLSVTRAPLTIKANDAGRLFGAANPTFTALYTGLVNGDNSSVVSGLALATAADTASAAGTYAITASGATAANYSISFLPGTLTISNALLTITANNAARTYGAANPAFSASYTGFTGTDTPAIVTGLQFSTSATTNSGVGTYAITPFGATAPNYAIDYVAGSLSISPAALTIRANDVARTYGAANPTFSGTFTGLVAGDTSASITGLTFATAATAASGIGDYAINVSGATNPNYTITQQPGTLTVNRAPLTVTADNLSKAFGAANPALTASYTGFVNGENASVLSGLALATTAVTASPNGTYPITASGATAANYAISFVNGTLTVGSTPLTITANNASRPYGAATPAFSASYAGFVNGDTAAVVSGLQFSTTATQSSGVGTYTITPFGASAPNYAISYIPGSLTLTPAALTIAANSVSRTYGAANPAFSAAYTGFVNGDTAAVVSGLSLASTATAASNVGTYAITPSGATASNYSISFTPGTLTVDRAALTIAADNKSKAFGETNPALTASYTGLVNGDTSAVVSGLALATTATTNSPNGSYPITASGATAANYSISFLPGTLSIGATALTITANNATRPYGAANPAFSATYTGFVNGDTAAVVSGLQFSTTATQSSGVGTYTITPFGATAPNYAISYIPGSLTLTPAALTIAATSLAKTYGAANPALTASYTGFVNGDTAAVVSGLTLATTATTGSGVGDYPITPAGATAPNYTVSFTPGTLTVNRAPLTLAGPNVSRTYGAANPAFTATYTGLVNGDTSAVVSGLTLATAATPASPVGNYAITLTGATAANYTITTDPGTLGVNPAPLTVTAANATRTYGDANPAFTGSITGFVNGESSSVLTAQPVFASAATLTSNVGNHPITGSGAAAANYSFTYTPGTLAITPATLAVRADNQVRTYGDANPTLTYSVSGLKNGDTADGKFFVSVFGTVAAPNSPVGNVAIQLTGTDVPNDNYTTFFAPGTLTIQPRPLTVRADLATREYGLPNPAFTATFTGLASFDSPSVIPNLAFTTAATTGSNVGDYTLTPTAGTNANYALTLLPNLLRITPAPLSVAVANASRTYGAPNPAFSYSLVGGGLRNGDTLASLGLGVSTSATAFSPVGGYAITPTTTNPNYQATTVSGSLLVTPAPLTVTPTNLSRPYGDANPTLTGTITGFANGETASVLTTQPTYRTDATVNSSAGTYPVTAAGGSASNYTFNYNPGSLVVTPALLTVRPATVSRPYGDSNPAFTLSFSGLKNNDNPATIIASSSFTTTATARSVVGSYPVSVTGGATANRNYSVVFEPGILNVTPRPLTITADAATREYGLANPSFTATFTGLASFDTTAAITGLSFSTVAATFGQVGNYSIFPSSASNPNYAITYGVGTLTVTPVPVNVTILNRTNVYGDAVSDSFGWETDTSAFRGSDRPALSISTTVTANTPAGTYPDAITASFTNPNYRAVVTGGTFTVTPAPLNVAFLDATRLYGNANPTVPFSLNGVKLGESSTSLVSIGSTATITSPVGSYPLTPTLLSPNYTIASTTARNLTVTPRLLTVTASHAQRLFGDSNPAFSYTLGGDGFAPGDTVTTFLNPSLSPAATSSSGVGTYSINVTTGTNANYSVRTTPGTLTVQPRPVTLTGLNLSRIFSDPNPTAFYTVGGAGLASFDSLSAIMTSPGTIPAVTADVGSYTLRAQLTNNPNYTVSVARDAFLTISPRPVTLTVRDIATSKTDLSDTPTTVSNLPSGVTVAQAFPFLTFRATPLTAPVERFGATLTGATSSLVEAIGYQSSVNYLVTAIPGYRTIVPEATTVDLGLTPSSFTLTSIERVPEKKPLTPAEAWAQGSSFGLPPAANATLAGLIKNQLGLAVARGDANFLNTLLGETAYAEMTKNGGPISQATIDAALAGFHDNKTKQALMLPALVDHVANLTAPGAKLNTTDTQILAAVAPFVAKARDAVIDQVAAEKKAYDDKKAANSAFEMGSVTQYAPTYPPYNEFMKAATTKVVEQRIQATSILLDLGAAAGGAMAAGGGLAVAMSVPSIVAAVTPHAAAATGTASFSAVSAGFAGGAAVAAIAAVAGIAVGTVQVVKAAEAEKNYNELMAQKGRPVTLAGFNTDENTKAMLATALLGMMANSVSLPPS